ncbi:MAG: hypothetical protein EPO40_34665 [Myxococcaceae bacterium]|nr:MAG: hypothetical protein EPO40_34665 [Myxococcaceae bacterium]
MTRSSALLALSLLTTACGASTGLREGDAGPDVPVLVDRPVNASVGAWERCFEGDSCRDGTACLPTGYSADGVPARMCTRACSRASACPVRGTHSTFPVGCATDTPETGVGQCYEVCETTANCGPGTQCVARSGLPFQLCLPVGAAR